MLLFFAFGNYSNAQCLCGTTASESRWDGIGFRINDDPINKYSCGYQLTVKTTAKITFVSGGYLCIAENGFFHAHTLPAVQGASSKNQIFATR